jgi:two-component system OmpR family response regulator
MNKERILIIDDEVDFTFLMKRYFENKGYQVNTAHTLTDGLKAVDDIQPLYIFLDNELPDGKGWEKAIYILANHPECELYLMSGSITSRVQYGKFKILEKPFSLLDLEKIVAQQRA